MQTRYKSFAIWNTYGKKLPYQEPIKLCQEMLSMGDYQDGHKNEEHWD